MSNPTYDHICELIDEVNGETERLAGEHEYYWLETISEEEYLNRISDLDEVAVRLALSPKEVFTLAQAYQSFLDGQLDQGTHIILPCRDVETDEEINACFTSLFSSYLTHIPPISYVTYLQEEKFFGLTGNKIGDELGLVYAGAIEMFCQDIGLDIGETNLINVFQIFA